MPTPLSNNATVQVVINSALNGQAILNVLHYRFNGTAPDYTLAMASLNAAIKGTGGIIDNLLSCMSNEAQIVSIWSQPIYPVRYRAVPEPVGGNGLTLGEAMPQNVAAVLTKQSESAERWGIGSFHIGGIARDSVTGGNINVGLTTPMNVLGLQLTQSFEDGEFQFTPILWSPRTPARQTPWNLFKVQRTVRVMRRRTVGVGI